MIDAIDAMRAAGTSARRLRRWWKRVLVVAVALALAWVTFGLWLGSRVRTSLDPIERMRALLPQAPESDRAWPAVRATLGPLKGTVDGSTDPDRRANALAAEWDAEPSADQDLLYAFLESHAGELSSLRSALQRPVLGQPLSCDATEEDIAFHGRTDDGRIDQPSRRTGFALFDLRLPQLADFRLTSGLLAADAVRVAKRGDGATAVADVDASLRMGTFCEEQPVLISVLVNAAIRARTQLVVARLMERYPGAFTDADLERLAAVLEQSPPPDLSRALAGERLGFEDVIQSMYTDDGNGDGVMVASPLLGSLVQVSKGNWEEPQHAFGLGSMVCALATPAVAMLAPTRAELMAEYDLLISETLANSTLPQAQWTDEADARIGRRMGGDWRSLDLLGMLAPAISTVGRVTQPQADLRQARFAVAMEQARRRLDTDAPMVDELFADARGLATDSLTGRPASRSVDRSTGAVRYGVRVSGDGAFGDGSPIVERTRPQGQTGDGVVGPPVDWLWLELGPAKGK